MDIEKSLLSRALLDNDIRPLIDAKISVDFFKGEANKAVWQFMQDYKQDFHALPTPKVLREECFDWKPTAVKEPIGYYIEKLRLQRKVSLLGEGIRAAAGAVDADPDIALSFLQSALAQVGTEITTMQDENLVTTWEDRLARYAELENLDGGLRGLPTGFQTIDRATSGLQGGQLITLVGTPKSGKSTTLMAVARAVHDYGKRPLFIGFEMSNEEQESRYDSMIARVSLTRLNNGTLTAEEKKRLHEELSRRKSMNEFILSADIAATTTLAGVDSKISQYMPDVVFIDGVYLMETPELLKAEPGSSQALTHLTRNLKRMAQKYNVPILITTQVLESRYNRKAGLQSKDVGYSSSFAQDSDVLLGVEQTTAPTVNILRVVIARSCPKIFTSINWDWDTGSFTEQFGGVDDGKDEAVDASAFDL